jgi:hypothetical protein
VLKYKLAYTTPPRPEISLSTKKQNRSSQVDDFTGSEHKALPQLYARRFGFDFDTFLLEHWEARLLM